MATITWAVSADFNRDGVFEFDLTPYVSLPGSGLQLSRGIDPSGRPRISTLNLAVNNNDGTFTPENSASSLYGLMIPNVPIQVTSTHNSLPFTHWTGYIRKFAPDWSAGAVPMCQLQCTDIAEDAAAFSPTNVLVSTARDTDGALVAIMDAMGLAAGDRNFDDGIQDLPYHFTRSQDGLTAMVEAALSEMGGLLWVTADGKFRFESRQSRLGIGSPDHAWGDGTAIIPKAIVYDLNNNDLISDVTVVPTIFGAGQADTEIFRFSRGKDTKPTADSLSIAAGDTYTASWDYDSPITALTTPEAVVDYLANDAANGTGTDRTSLLTVTVTDLGAGATIALKNTHSGAIYVTKFRLRGQPAAFSGQSPHFQATKSIPGAKLNAGVTLRVPFGSDSQAVRDYAVASLRTYRYPYPKLTLTFDGATTSSAANDTTKKSDLLAVELGELVYYKDTGLGTSGAMVKDWWYVEAIQMTIPPNWGGANFGLVVTLSPSYNYRNLDRCTYDAFTRADVVGDLGTGTSGDVWSGDSGFDIVSNKARPNSTALQIPVLTV